MRRRTALKLTFAAAASAAGARVGRARMRGPARVVVIGGGFAGAACALQLRAMAPSLEVELIDPAATYVTCPMSNGALVGLCSLASLSVDRDGLQRHAVRVIRDEVDSIDIGRRRMRLKRAGTRGYDRLVFAAGIRFLWNRPEGYTEAAAEILPHAWKAGAQTTILASQIASLRPGGVVAISVPVGPMRCPPGPFERASLIAGYLQRHNPRSKIVILDANNRFPRQEVFSDAWKELYPGMIEWVSVLDGGAVERVDAVGMIVHTGRGPLRADVINIIPPQAPAQLAVESGLASAHGWCPVEPDGFASTLAPNVHVIGDACIADPMPKAASSANAQAKRCARAIVLALAGRANAAQPLESVCYSSVTADTALSIHAGFELADGSLRSIAVAPEHADPAAARPSAEEARNARAWYARIRADSFGV